MNRYHSIIILLILIILSISGSVVADSALILEIPEEVILSSQKFDLGDLGVIRGGSEADRKLLEKISLGSVPPPGQVRIFSRTYLQLLLNNYTFTKRPDLQMGNQVTVRAEAFCLQRSAIERVVWDLVQTTRVDGVERWIELENLPEVIWLPQGKWHIKAEPIGQIPLVGRALFKVTITDSGNSKDINVSGEVHAKAFIYRAIRNVPSRFSLKPEDFVLEKAELDGREFIGKLPDRIRSTTAIRKGKILFTKQFEESPLVNKGSIVTVIIKDGDFEINLTGIARTEGWLDQKILIMNPVSKKCFAGRVTGIDTVEVTMK